MSYKSNSRTAAAMVAALAASVPIGVFAQEEPVERSNIVVQGQELPIPATSADLPKGPEVRGLIAAKSGDRFKVMTEDGTEAIIAINPETRIRSSKGLFSRASLDTASLLNGLPVTVKTAQAGDMLVATQINLRNRDLKTAKMIRTGTAQGFAEQTAATEALRGRMGDIDQYNIKGTTSVNFDTAKWNLTEQGKAELCQTAQQAEATKNALLLVVGYTDSVGDEDYNQQLSEKRASRVVNHLQQACGWKPYRMLTPTGMAESDPMADNTTEEGKAQNRRVSVNILVSKGLDGL